MKTIYYNADKPLDAGEQLGPCVATIGFFDGVHTGHRYLIDRLVKTAHAEGREAVVITFDEHPRKVLQSDYQPEQLCTLDSKLILLSKTGIDATVVLHFDRRLADMSAQEFMQQVLCRQLHVCKLFIGYDHRFGHNRQESFDDYVRYGAQMGMEVVQAQAFDMDGVHISSSAIRGLLKEGEVELANRCLDYPYTIIGKVVSGYHEGHKLGFPTANLDISHFGQLVPAPGVYAVKVRLERQIAMRWGMMNIGVRPTFGGKVRTLEAHIFNFEGDIYDQLLLVSFVKRIRAERKFDSADELAEQLREDEQAVLALFAKEME